MSHAPAPPPVVTPEQGLSALLDVKRRVVRLTNGDGLSWNDQVLCEQGAAAINDALHELNEVRKENGLLRLELDALKAEADDTNVTHLEAKKGKKP
jgi:hypothetical protein